MHIIDYPLRKVFLKKDFEKFFNTYNLSAFKLPEKSTLIKSEKRNIGKTLLIRVWQEFIKNRIVKFTKSREKLIKKFPMTWDNIYYPILKKYSSYYICERDISKYYADITNGEWYYDFTRRPKYFFIDDFCYENSYRFSGGKTDQNFINFIREMLEYLCNNKEIIVIATTNNNPANILCPESIGITNKNERAEILSKSSLFTRYHEIFLNKVEIL